MMGLCLKSVRCLTRVLEQAVQCYTWYSIFVQRWHCLIFLYFNSDSRTSIMAEVTEGNNSFFRQLSIVSIICLGNFITGSMHGWTAPALVKLRSGKEIFSITDDNASWLALCSEIGHFLVPIPAGILADIFGRKPIFLLSSLFALTGWTVMLFASNFAQFIVGRTLLGFNYGIQGLMMNIYVAEISSKQTRGTFGSLLYLCTNVGVLFQFVIVPFITLKMTSFITFVLCFLQFVLCWFIIESPYFLVAVKKEEEATKTLSWLRAAPQDKVVDEFNNIIERVKVKQGVVKSFKILTSKPDCTGFILCTSMSFLNDLTGRVPVLSYATENFDAAGSNKYMLTILLGICNVLFPFIPVFLSDRVGRRILLISSTLLGAVMHFITALLYFLTLHQKIEIIGGQWLLFVTITGYLCCCSIHTTNVLTLRGDLLSENSRGFASGFASTAFGLAAVVDLKLFAFAKGNYEKYSAFWMLCVFSVVFGVFTFTFIPETKNRTFEEIQTCLTSKKKKKIVEKR